MDRSNIIICNFVSFSIHICDIIWYVLQYMYERQSEFSSLMNYVFDATGSDSIVGYNLPKFRRNLQVCSFVGLSVCLSVRQFCQA